MKKTELAAYIDHTVLKADTTQDTVKRICQEARECGFAAVCINPSYVDFASRELSGSSVKVCTVVGFPLGANTTSVKVYEATQAIKANASEIDMVMSIGAFKSGNFDIVEREIQEVVLNTTKIKGSSIVKVIIEACYLTDAEKVIACKLSKNAGAHFVKTSTGFGSGGAEIHDVRIMHETVGGHLGIKAAGGIGSYSKAVSMIEAGATRIGASAGLKIIADANG